MIQQRQYFARRREQNHHNARRARVRQAINSFRRSERPPADSNRVRRVLDQSLPVGADFLLLANPSANDSVIADFLRPYKRPRLEEPRRGGRHEPDETVNRQAVQDLDLEASNDIRIFDDNVEKTHQFRRRTLPHDFLNSQITGNHRRRDRHRAEEHSRNAVRDLRNWNDADPSKERARVAHRRRDSSPPPIQMDHVVDMTEPSRRVALTPDPAYRRDVRSPGRLSQQLCPTRFRSPTSSAVNDCSIPNRRLEEDDVVEATPSDEEHRTAYKNFLLGVSPNARNETKARLPTAQKLLSTLTAISPHFPPVKIDSDSSESLAQYRPTKKKEKYKFRSLLCNEDITSGHFSATVQELEKKLLNIPDRDVPFLSLSNMSADRKKTKSSGLRGEILSDSGSRTRKGLKSKAFTPTFAIDLTHTRQKPSLGGLPEPRKADEQTDVDKAMCNDPSVECRANIITKPGNDSIGMDVALGCDMQNPVTLAADGAFSEMTAKGRR